MRKEAREGKSLTPEPFLIRRLRGQQELSGQGQWAVRSGIAEVGTAPGDTAHPPPPPRPGCLMPAGLERQGVQRRPRRLHSGHFLPDPQPLTSLS